MTTFDERLGTGTALERRVAGEFENRAYAVTAWGQGMLPELTRKAIRESRSSFRYFPDLVASRPGELVTVDCKDHMHSVETNTYAVSIACVDFGIQFAAVFGLPLFYVFGNLGVLSPYEVKFYGQRGRRATSGAYYLVDGRVAHHFDDVFGSPGRGLAA